MSIILSFQYCSFCCVTCSIGRQSWFIQLILWYVLFKGPGHDFLQQLDYKRLVANRLNILKFIETLYFRPVTNCHILIYPTRVMIILLCQSWCKLVMGHSFYSLLMHLSYIIILSYVAFIISWVIFQHCSVLSCWWSTSTVRPKWIITNHVCQLWCDLVKGQRLLSCPWYKRTVLKFYWLT